MQNTVLKLSNKCLFFSTGTAPSFEVPYDTYPIVVNPDHDPSAKVLVVQDYTFGKYLGRLDVEFDVEGKIVSYSGNPILLDDSVEQGKLKTKQSKQTKTSKQIVI